MNDNQTNETQNYQTLDKDYGRQTHVGIGYGEVDIEQYKILEALVK